jgi:hypothetical protein
MSEISCIALEQEAAKSTHDLDSADIVVSFGVLMDDNTKCCMCFSSALTTQRILVRSPLVQVTSFIL